MHEIPAEAMLDVRLRVSVEIGRVRMPVAAAIAQSPGALVDLDRAPEDAVDLLVNGRPFGRGRLVVVDGEWALRIEELEGFGEPRPTGVQAA